MIEETIPWVKFQNSKFSTWSAIWDQLPFIIIEDKKRPLVTSHRTKKKKYQAVKTIFIKKLHHWCLAGLKIRIRFSSLIYRFVKYHVDRISSRLSLSHMSRIRPKKVVLFSRNWLGWNFLPARISQMWMRIYIFCFKKTYSQTKKISTSKFIRTNLSFFPSENKRMALCFSTMKSAVRVVFLSVNFI